MVSLPSKMHNCCRKGYSDPIKDGQVALILRIISNPEKFMLSGTTCLYPRHRTDAWSSAFMGQFHPGGEKPPGEHMLAWTAEQIMLLSEAQK